MVDIRKITMSRAVTDAHMKRRDRVGGLDILVRLRRRRSQYFAARKNMAEDYCDAIKIERAFGPGAAYDAGLSVGAPPKADCCDYVRRALHAGFPLDTDAQEVKKLCEEFLK